MQNNQNLWIGLLIGSGLTGLLMYALYQQADPFEAAPPTTATATPVIAPFVKPEPVATTKLETAELSTTNSKPVEASATKQSVPTSEVKTTTAQIPAKPQKIDLPGLPENPRLPEKELAKLSPEEREKYEKVLTTYQQARDKVLSLHQEREQLEQQINRIIEENTTIDRQLEKMKENQQIK